jgi:hypothetical protein
MRIGQQKTRLNYIEVVALSVMKDLEFMMTKRRGGMAGGMDLLIRFRRQEIMHKILIEQLATVASVNLRREI